MSDFEIKPDQLWQPAGIDHATFMALPFKTYPKEMARVARDAGIMFTTMFAQLLEQFEMMHPVTIIYDKENLKGGKCYGCKLYLDQYRISAVARMEFNKAHNSVTFYGPIGLFAPPRVDDFEPVVFYDRFVDPLEQDVDDLKRFGGLTE